MTLVFCFVCRKAKLIAQSSKESNKQQAVAEKKAAGKRKHKEMKQKMLTEEPPSLAELGDAGQRRIRRKAAPRFL